MVLNKIAWAWVRDASGIIVDVVQGELNMTERWRATAILIISEGHETAFNGFSYQFTTGKSLEILQPTLNYYEKGSSARRRGGYVGGMYKAAKMMATREAFKAKK